MKLPYENGRDRRAFPVLLDRLRPLGSPRGFSGVNSDMESEKLFEGNIRCILSSRRHSYCKGQCHSKPQRLDWTCRSKTNRSKRFSRVQASNSGYLDADECRQTQPHNINIEDKKERFNRQNDKLRRYAIPHMVIGFTFNEMRCVFNVDGQPVRGKQHQNQNRI